MSVREPAATQERLGALLDANRLIVSELSLDAVLQQIVESAKDVARARFAALGVIGVDGTLEQFIHVGVDAATVNAINRQPQGLGILGDLIANSDPIRVQEVVKDPRYAGFPPGHPRLRSFLGVPIQVPGSVFGNLYLAEREGGVFTAEDEELVLALATTAGIAIENARLYEESRHRQEWLRARAEVARHLVTADQADSLHEIAEAVVRLAEADVVSVVRPVPGTSDLRILAAAGVVAEEILGFEYPAQNAMAGLAMDRGTGMVFDEVTPYAESTLFPGRFPDCEAKVGSVMALPLVSEHGMAGAVLVARAAGRRRFSASDKEMAESFATQAAVAMELAEARTNTERLVLLQDRDRIARDLHDHVIQRLFAIGLGVKSIATGPPASTRGHRLLDLVDDLDETIRQIRTTIFELRDTTGTDNSLRAAVLAVILDVEATLPGRPDVIFDGPLDTVLDAEMVADVEAVVREGLVNIARHAGADRVWVRVELAGRTLSVIIGDDGQGVEPGVRRSGLDNLRRRAERHRGELTIDAPEGGGTRLIWEIPIDLSAAAVDRPEPKTASLR